MADRSGIEWTDATWNPIRARNKKTGKVGWHCEHATTGCEFCYAEGFNKRLGTGLPFKPGHRRDVELFLDGEFLTQPLRWKKPRRIFPNSMTDLFADFVPVEWIDKIFAVMALTPQHTYQVLTKRAARMQDYFNFPSVSERVANEGVSMIGAMTLQRADTRGYVRGADHGHPGERLYRNSVTAWPPPNVWLGVSAERQQEADERIPLLLDTPAAVRFISAEPLLGPIDLRWIAERDDEADGVIDALSGFNWIEGAGPSAPYRPARPGHADRVMSRQIVKDRPSRLDWVIVGGESGTQARPMHPDWARTLRDQCRAAGVQFFFKQWGEYRLARAGEDLALSGMRSVETPPYGLMRRVGKIAAGRRLDGELHDQFPTQGGSNGV